MLSVDDGSVPGTAFSGDSTDLFFRSLIYFCDRPTSQGCRSNVVQVNIHVREDAQCALRVIPINKVTMDISCEAREHKPPPKKLDADGINSPAKIIPKLWAKATKLKTQFLATVSVALEIQEAIDKDPMWSWTKKPQKERRSRQRSRSQVVRLRLWASFSRKTCRRRVIEVPTLDVEMRKIR